MNIRDEWNALGKLIGFFLEGLLYIGGFFAFLILMDSLGI